MRFVILALALLPLAFPATVAAQGRAPTARLEAIAKRVADLDKLAADVPALLEALRKLQQEVSTLRRQLARRQTKAQGYRALRARVDGLAERLGDLQLRLTAMRLGGGGGGAENCADTLCMRAFGGKLALEVHGYLSAAYEGSIAGERRQLAGGRVGQHRSGFVLDRARLITAGTLMDPRLRFRLALELGSRAERLLLDASVAFRWHAMIGVEAGVMRVPYGRQYALELETTLFADRSPVTEAFYPGRDAGVLLFGTLVDSPRFGRLGYQLGAFNGASQRGEELVDDNTDFLYAGRLSYEPLGPLDGETDASRSALRLAFGVSAYYNLVPTDAAQRAGASSGLDASGLRDQNGDGDVDNVGVLGLNAEIAARWRGLSWQSELFYRYEDPGAVSESRSFWGVYTQLGARHRSGIELAARYGFWEASRYGDDGAVVDAARVHEVAAALGTWLFGSRLRLQTGYGHRWLRGLGSLAGGEITDASAREHLVYVQTRLAF